MKKSHCVIQGDCLDLMRRIPDGAVDMILADLPYGVTANKGDSVIPFDLLWAAYRRVIKGNGAIVLSATQPFTSALVMSNPGWFKYEWIWDKVNPSGFQIAKYRPMMRHENICVFANGTPKYRPIKEMRDKPLKAKCGSPSKTSPLAHNDGVVRVYEDKHPQSILVFRKGSDGRYVHPTQKPVALFEYLIRTYTDPGDTVLDNTMGSGTTGVAAIRAGRRFVGFELDPDYFRIASGRVDEEAQAARVKEADGQLDF